MTERELYLKAAQIMRERGKCAGQFQDAAGRVCMLGALRAAVVGAPIFPFLPLREITNYDIGAFSDSSPIEDCIAAFEIAADLAA